MNRPTALALSTSLLLLAGGLAAAGLPPASAAPAFSAGDAGIGDPYFPLDGNGGYDVGHYRLDVRLDPATRAMTATATIDARATQSLSKLDLDLDGLTVRSVTVGGRVAKWTRSRGEMVVTPGAGIAAGTAFRTVVTYDGVPVTFDDLGITDGAVPTPDGVVVLGEPHVASAWFPANDHPSDKASFDIRLTVPTGVEAVSNGSLVSSTPAGGWTTWRWDAPDPMATYLAFAAVGQLDVTSHRNAGIRYWDAVAPALDVPDAPAPRTGSAMLFSQRTSFEGASYKRLSRTLTVPAAGGHLSFWVDRQTEDDFDYLFVEAHHSGQDDWTTLPDLNGHTSPSTGFACPFSLVLHPTLSRYQSDDGTGGCTPSGTTGTWSAASGASDGYEQWDVDLGAYAGTDAEVSISYVSDDAFQRRGVFVDDVTTTTGTGGTTFEPDGDTMDGWSVPGAPSDEPANENDWTPSDGISGFVTTYANARASLSQQPEIIATLAQSFGRYPFGVSGGVVHLADVGFALENQTRPTYDAGFFTDGENSGVIAHELAHEWYGDSVAVRRWQDIWLNEGFATYAEWLWSAHQGFDTPQEIYDFLVTEVPADDGLWALEIGDPTPEHLFDFPVYVRGALTLQALRIRVGDTAFFTILKRWASERSGGNGDTAGFVALAERVSGQQLDGLFDTWLHTAQKPQLDAARAFALPRTTSMPVVLRPYLTGRPIT